MPTPMPARCVCSTHILLVNSCLGRVRISDDKVEIPIGIFYFNVNLFHFVKKVKDDKVCYFGFSYFILEFHILPLTSENI